MTISYTLKRNVKSNWYKTIGLPIFAGLLTLSHQSSPTIFAKIGSARRNLISKKRISNLRFVIYTETQRSMT